MLGTDSISITLSAIALVVSIYSIWIGQRRGKVVMTRPTIISFGPDDYDGTIVPKVYLRTLLFSTSKRGCVLESMYVTLSKKEVRQSFELWIYSIGDLIERGSGLRIDDVGVALHHHFIKYNDGSGFGFSDGEYTLSVYAQELNRKPHQIFQCVLNVSRDEATAIRQGIVSLWFDWSPTEQKYISRLDKPEALPAPQKASWIPNILRSRSPEQ